MGVAGHEISKISTDSVFIFSHSVWKRFSIAIVPNNSPLFVSIELASAETSGVYQTTTPTTEENVVWARKIDKWECNFS